MMEPVLAILDRFVEELSKGKLEERGEGRWKVREALAIFLGDSRVQLVDKG